MSQIMELPDFAVGPDEPAFPFQTLVQDQGGLDVRINRRGIGGGHLRDDLGEGRRAVLGIEAADLVHLGRPRERSAGFEDPAAGLSYGTGGHGVRRVMSEAGSVNPRRCSC